MVVESGLDRRIDGLDSYLVGTTLHLFRDFGGTKVATFYKGAGIEGDRESYGEGYTVKQAIENAMDEVGIGFTFSDKNKHTPLNYWISRGFSLFAHTDGLPGNPKNRGNIHIRLEAYVSHSVGSGPVEFRIFNSKDLDPKYDFQRESILWRTENGIYRTSYPERNELGETILTDEPLDTSLFDKHAWPTLWRVHKSIEKRGDFEEAVMLALGAFEQEVKEPFRSFDKSVQPTH